MNHYLYLILGFIFLIPTVVVAIMRRDLRRGIAYVGSLGAIWGPISEFWFFRDYWHPASVLGNPVLEDVVYGAGISATAWCLYKVVFRRTNSAPGDRQTRYGEFGGIVALYVAAMLVLATGLGINSILVATGVYIVSAIYIIVRRRDLLTASLATATMMGLIALIGYGIGLNLLVREPATLSHLWFLYHKPLGVTIVGYVPLTEVVWYTAWGSLLGILYEFATGRQIVARQGTTGTGPGLSQISQAGKRASDDSERRGAAAR